MKKLVNHRRLFSLLFALLIMMSAVTASFYTVSATEVQKTANEKSYDIAVVFDNSGSMYQPDSKGDSKAWCRAKYAIEIFASMLNYENGDKLRVYPMWEVTTDGSKPSTGGSYSAIEINNKRDIDKISNLYTVNPSNTPFAPVLEAQKYLKSTNNGKTKWLIVLTDGMFNQIERNKNVGDISASDLKNRLLKVATDGINVQYLGFAGASKLESEEEKRFFAKKSTDTSLKDDLIDICNSIFQRSILPENRLSGNKLNIDLSMKKVIVFAQGSNAKITSLKNAKGTEITKLLDSGQRKYSNIKAKLYDNAQVDKTLAGQVVTFDACAKGEYTLNYSDADKIQIFYEPDVDIDVALTNSDGVKVDNPNDFVAGEYKVTSKIVDATTGEDVTSHELMGKNVSLKTYMKTSADSKAKEYKNGDTIDFKPDDNTELWVEGKYLDKYTITSKDNAKLSWLNNLKVAEQKVDLKLDVSAKQKWYQLKDNENWKPIKVTLSLDGKPLTKEQLSVTKLSLETTDGFEYRTELLENESAYNVYIGQNKDGKYVEPQIGKHKITATATYTDEYGETTTTNPKEANFEIAKYNAFLAWIVRNLWWILLIIAIILLWLFYMTRKVMPKNILKDTARFVCMSAGTFDEEFVDLKYHSKAKTLTLGGPDFVELDEQCEVTLKLKPLNNRFTKSNKRKFAVVGISSTNCEEIDFNPGTYVQYDGTWIDEVDLTDVAMGQPPANKIYHEMSTDPSFTIITNRQGHARGTLECSATTR